MCAACASSLVPDNLEPLEAARLAGANACLAHCYLDLRADVVHSFKINPLRVTQDAIPGLRIPTWFKPTKEGRYQIYCAQLCGNGHASMAGGFLVVESEEAYGKWLRSKYGAATSFE